MGNARSTSRVQSAQCQSYFRWNHRFPFPQIGSCPIGHRVVTPTPPLPPLLNPPPRPISPSPQTVLVPGLSRGQISSLKSLRFAHGRGHSQGLTPHRHKLVRVLELLCEYFRGRVYHIQLTCSLKGRYVEATQPPSYEITVQIRTGRASPPDVFAPSEYHESTRSQTLTPLTATK